jgi:hypothetical protein
MTKNQIDWNRLVARCDHSEHSEGEWTWVEVGHNSSHSFYVGHNADFSTFAVKSIGDTGEEDANGMGVVATHIHRHSPSLAETINGAYLGHD